VTDLIVSLVPLYGLPILALAVYLSCLALPVPSSLVILTCGSFVGSGDLEFSTTALVAICAAVLGDQTGYLLGKIGGPALVSRLAKTNDRRAVFDKASDWIDKKGGPGVFLSRWLVSPLGPYVNIISGVAALPWRRFTLWSAAGEVVWVGIYIGLGLVFSDNISAVAEVTGNLSGILAAGLVTLLLGWQIAQALRKHRHAG